jgi:hypothetical protein
MLNHFSGVMAGLVPAIHAFSLKGRNKDVDARDKRGHDVERWFDLIGTRSSLLPRAKLRFAALRRWH